MVEISLGKVIRKSGFAHLLQRLTASLETPLVITDSLGSVLLATEGTPENSRHPVSLQGETIGWVHGNDKAALLASLLSYHAAQELERKQLGSETLNKFKEITLLYEMADKIPAYMERREIAAYLIEQIRQVITFDQCAVFLHSGTPGELETLAAYGSGYLAGATIKPTGIKESVWKSGKGEIVNDVLSDARYREEPVPACSLMCVPLKVKESMTGLVYLSSSVPVAYRAEELKLFSTLASQAAAQIENAALYVELKEAFYAMVYTLAETIEMRDPYTGNHTKRVMEYSLALGRTLGLSHEEMTRLELAAVLHDIGKIGVRDDVLLKQSRLDDDEFMEIMRHTDYGEEILSRVPQLFEIIPGVKQHHERFDGTGYPDGLKGDQIDITAKIIAVADTFDAMTTDRPYRKGFPFEEAFEELRKNASTQFDPEVVKAFFAMDVMEAYFAARTK